MSYSPTDTDATAVATDTVARLNTSPSPNLGAVLRDALVALQDSMLCAVGTRLVSNNALTTGSRALSAFADISGTSIIFTAPIAKNYTVHCDFSAFFSVAGYGFVRLVIGSSAGPSIIIDQSGGTFNYHTPIHLMHNAACVAGANTIKLQWSASVGTINTSALDYANFLVHG